MPPDVIFFKCLPAISFIVLRFVLNCGTFCLIIFCTDNAIMRDTITKNSFLATYSNRVVINYTFYRFVIAFWDFQFKVIVINLFCCN